MNGTRHPVWFERPVLPDLVDEVTAQVVIVGPTDDDPWRGLDVAEGALAGAGRYDAGFMDRAPRLKVISRTGIGVDAVDLEAATARGIMVCNTPDGPTVSTAEHAMTLILAAAKNLKGSEAALRDTGGGRGNFYARHDAIELDGKVLGLAGFGRIARHLAQIASGFGMRVAAYDPYIAADSFPPHVARAEDLVELLRGADVVSVHVPLNEESRRMFDSVAFSQMKQDAVFVNTARGGLVDHDALLAALDEGRLFAAGLDVTEPEPLSPDDPLLSRLNVVVTPHVASGTRAGKRRLFRMALEQAVTALEGTRPAHLVNAEVRDGPAAAPATRSTQ